MNKTALLFALLLAACGSSEPTPKPDTTPPEPPATDAPSATPDMPTGAPTADAPTKDVTRPAAPALKDTLGAIAKVEIQAGGKKKSDVAKKDVDALLKAIGLDQSPSGNLRKCPDILTLVFKDASGAEKGSVGFCGEDVLGPEFWAQGQDRKGITLADEAAVRKIAKIPAPKPAKGGKK